jgi:hypothetical protein
MNLAVREGKGLEQLRERTLGRYGIREMAVLESSHVGSAHEIVVVLHAARLLTAKEGYFMHRTVDEVNRRFGIHIRVDISDGNI